MDLRALPTPVVVAPMAGGPSTPDLVAAVAEAGGLGFLAAGYKTPDAVAAEIAAVRSRTDRPFGVNLFVYPPDPPDPQALADYAEVLDPEAVRHGVTLGQPREDDDHLAAKLDLLCRERVPVVSFTFGLPPAPVLPALRAAGCTLIATVTTPEQAATAGAAGMHGLVVQGIEAGGHRGGLDDAPEADDDYGLLVLLRLVARQTRLPLIAAGGVVDGAGVAAVLAAGAVAAQVGTLFLACPEAGTNAPLRAALGGPGTTALTRAFTGRRARGIVNAFMTRYSGRAPAAFPQVHHLTGPLRAAGLATGDKDAVPLWSGQGHRLAAPVPAGDLVRRLDAEAKAALRTALDRTKPE